jgi:NADH:ubiquinone oxidoreductase subunit K
MHPEIGRSLAIMVAAALAAIGVAGLAAPRRASGEYGIVLDDARALGLIRAMAVRDVALGGLLGLLALTATRDVLGWAMCLTALVAAVDLAVVTADRRAASRAVMHRASVLHGGGLIGLLVAAGVLWAGY